MKTYKLFKPLLIFMFSIAWVTGVFSQQTREDKKQDKMIEIENLVQSKNYLFIAQSATPQAGRMINLTSMYNLKVSGDTLLSELPYFGRAYVAPLNPAESGIRFTSTDYAYTVNDNKKGVWEILIEPKSGQDVRQMYLTVSDNGYASFVHIILLSF